jgi:hypothetical protein
MPRFFFDVYDGANVTKDTAGLDVPTLEVAITQAQALLLVLKEAASGDRGIAYSVSVRGVDGVIRVIVSLQTKMFIPNSWTASRPD